VVTLSALRLLLHHPSAITPPDGINNTAVFGASRRHLSLPVILIHITSRMRSTIRAIAALASTALIATSNAQTYTNCNPTLRSDCPPDTALGKTVNIDFSSESDSFTAQGNPTYGSDGVSFTIRQSGDSPQLTSKWYIMFGKVEMSCQAAPGAGIVSSFVLQSDDLDEIDWEWLGADPDEVQSNYFGK
jgi:hypothetical protein